MLVVPVHAFCAEGVDDVTLIYQSFLVISLEAYSVRPLYGVG